MTASERIRVARLARLTLGEAENQYSYGGLSQLEYEAYRRAWSDAGGTECGYHAAQGWDTSSDNPAVEQLAAQLVAFAANARR